MQRQRLAEAQQQALGLGPSRSILPGHRGGDHRETTVRSLSFRFLCIPARGPPGACLACHGGGRWEAASRRSVPVACIVGRRRAPVALYLRRPVHQPESRPLGSTARSWRLSALLRPVCGCSWWRRQHRRAPSRSGTARVLSIRRLRGLNPHRSEGAARASFVRLLVKPFSGYL